MTKSKSLKESLVPLGSDRLAALLVEMAEADSAFRKRLVLAAAEADGPRGLTKAIDRRLKALSGSRGAISWERARGYANELDGLRAAMADGLAPVDLAAATERMIQFIGLAPRVFDRMDDSNGRAGAVFARAVKDWAKARSREPGNPATLAGQVFALVLDDDYGICDGLVEAMAPALGAEGLKALTARVDAALVKIAATGKASSAGGVDWRRHRLKALLAEVADIQGDVDAYIALQTSEPDLTPDIAGVAARLLRAGRPEEALVWLDRPVGREIAVARFGPSGAIAIFHPRAAVLVTLRIAVLDALGRRAEAQELRWRQFELNLDIDALRDYVRNLGDFEEFDALDRAFAVAQAHRDAGLGLHFFIGWNEPAHAARLVEDRLTELSGSDSQRLEPAAEALSSGHPRTATRLYRRMIDSVLERGASAAYPHAARYLAACAALADQLGPGEATLSSHADYASGLRARHGRKQGFWGLTAV